MKTKNDLQVVEGGLSEEQKSAYWELDWFQQARQILYDFKTIPNLKPELRDEVIELFSSFVQQIPLSDRESTPLAGRLPSSSEFHDMFDGFREELKRRQINRLPSIPDINEFERRLDDFFVRRLDVENEVSDVERWEYLRDPPLRDYEIRRTKKMLKALGNPDMRSLLKPEGSIEKISSALRARLAELEANDDDA